MAFDVKAKVEEIVEKLKKDDELMALFKKDPVAALEKVTGLDLPDDKIDAVVDAVKAKIGLDNIGDALKGLGGLLGKKE